MKKLLCMLVILVLVGSMPAALAEGCKYEGQGAPCDVKWWVDTAEKKHCRACFYHVEDKEDMNSHVPVTDWAPCTLDAGGECTTCGWDYVREPENDNMEKYLLEYFIAMGMEAGAMPVDVSISGSTLEIGFAKYFRNAMMEKGYLTSESLMVSSEYTLTLPGGSEYAYAGEPVTPEIELEKTDYGSGVWLEEQGILSIGNPVYANNDAPGTAMVSVDIAVKWGKTYSLTKSFTITGEVAPERLPGDADDNEGVELNDAIAILRVLSGEATSISSANADVNGDGKVDLHDVLLILQYLAGWNVSLT